MKTFKDMTEAKIIATDYSVGYEKSRFNNGFRAKVTNKETDRVMYLGQTSWKATKDAAGEAEAYLRGYATGGEFGARKRSNEYKKKFSSNIVKESVELDEALEVKLRGGKVPVGQHRFKYDVDKSDKYIENSIKERDKDAKVERKGNDLWVTASAQAHSSVIAGMRKFRVNGTVSESVELDEAKSKAGDALMAYAKKSGGIDKNDMMKIAGKLQNHAATGNPSNVADIAKMLKNMDTDPRDKVIEICMKNDPAMCKSIMRKAGLQVREETEVDEMVGRYSPLRQARLKKEKEDRAKTTAPKRNPGTGLRKEEVELDERSPWGDLKVKFHKTFNKNYEKALKWMKDTGKSAADAERMFRGTDARELAKMASQMESVEEAVGKFSDKQIKMAYGILNDPRWKGGNMTSIVRRIEGIAKGLSSHPGVRAAIQRTNEETESLIASLIEEETMILESVLTEEVEEMAVNQIRYIRYALEEIEDALYEEDADMPEWFEAKLTEAFVHVKDLHTYIEATGGLMDDEEEDEEEIDEYYESTQAYADSQRKIARDRQQKMMKPGEMDKLRKLRAMLDKEKKK